jgi:hypothetical protein
VTPGFGAVAQRFSSGLFIPYTLEDGIYAMHTRAGSSASRSALGQTALGCGVEADQDGALYSILRTI